MPRNLFIAVVLSTCLQLTALARTPRVALPQKLPQAVELQQFYSSLHKVLGKQSLWNKADEEFINLKPLQEFLKGTKLTDEIHAELNVFREEYAAILGDKVDIADLLKYSELQALAEGASSSDTQANDYIELVDSVIKDLPVKDKLYMFTIKLTLADDTEVTLIKPGMSVPHNISKRVREQINSLEKIAFDPSGVTFNIRDQSLDIVKSLKVVKMEVKQVNLVDNKQKYLDLNYGVADTDVHRQLVANGYQMVHGIPNIKGGERKEVFVKLNGKDNDHVKDVVTVLEQANDQTYLERQAKTNGLNGSGISLSLPTKQQVELIFAEIEFSAEAFETERARLAKMLLEIKWYEHRTGNDNVAQQLRDKFDELFKNSTDAAEIEEIEHLSEEVFVLRKIITAIQAVEGGYPAVVGHRLGLGSGYSYTSHMNKEFDTVALVVMGIVINTKYPEHKYQDLHVLLGELLDLRSETKEKVQLLQNGIDMVGGWQTLRSALNEGSPSSAAQFRSALAGTVLREETTAERIAEVVLLYRIITPIQAKDDRVVYVASKLGLSKYSYVDHLKKELDTTKLVAMATIINNEYPEHEHQTLHALFGQLLDLRGEKKEVKEAMQLLQNGIDKAGGWQALPSDLKEGNSNVAAKFLNDLGNAAIDGVAAEQIEATEKRTAEVVLLYRIISAIKQDGERPEAVGSRLGLRWGYSYVSHLEKGREFDLEVLQRNIEAIKAKKNHKKNTELHNSLDNSIELLGTVYDPVQQVKQSFLNIIKSESEKENVEAEMKQLDKGINKAGGWEALQSALKKGDQGDPRAAGRFRKALARAAIDGVAAKQIEVTEKRMAEVVLLYRIITTIQKKGEWATTVARKLGLSDYSYTSHLEKGVDTAKLVAMGITINNEYPEHEHQTLHALFGDLLDLRGERKEVKEAVQLLQKGIDKAGGWQALKSGQTGDPTAATRLLNNLARAAIDGVAAEQIEATEKRIAEVVLFYRIITAIKAVEGGYPKVVGSKLGLGSEYSFTSHLNKEFDTVALVVMGFIIDNEYPEHEHQTLHALFGNLLDLRGERKEVKEPVQLLQTGINKAGGWLALQSAMRTGDASAAAQFINNLALAAIDGAAAKQIEATEKRIAEVVLLYRIISAIKAVEGEDPQIVGSKLGLGEYSYTSHLNKEFDTVALVVMGFIIDNEYPEYQDLGALFGDLLDLRGERKEVKEPVQLLQTGINKAGGWLALQSAMRTGDASAAAQFLNNLARAALRGEEAAHITEVVLLYRIISPIQKKGEEIHAVASRLGLGRNYSYKSHLQEGREFNLQELKESVEAIKAEHEENTELHENLNDSIKLLQQLREPKQQLREPKQLVRELKQLELPFSP